MAWYAHWHIANDVVYDVIHTFLNSPLGESRVAKSISPTYPYHIYIRETIEEAEEDGAQLRNLKLRIL
ncbi:hypothetical protein KSX_75260 [Ktedonospora formicarum]|uniref:Uncharacterized protein n=1 Tax=Ktedonospora formicarum TaxID=2778364 RepID=A0A8J3MX48_9CHLR|nr:hypothetical protein KSX_75260 [Ktedonospora formicarum]